ncbi:hypothetical protein F4604DRAFT_1901256 [Suillus subluteus]|nr:hypothetical protein F4604DRAFT_1901256 [Suillus subluteus]
MTGFLSLVLVSIALLQMTAAAPTVSERSQAVKKREGDQNIVTNLQSVEDCEIKTSSDFGSMESNSQSPIVSGFMILGSHRDVLVNSCFSSMTSIEVWFIGLAMYLHPSYKNVDDTDVEKHTPFFTYNVDDEVLDDPEGYRSARRSHLSETAGSCLGRPSEDQVLQNIKAVMVQ